ncbi:gamma-glutamylcyclotransferase [Halostella sp. JP-L12]|uniref:gamma-glutamylcyclotransferase family protein n=1 Tax=Halostella TaxID=1843185 RepID=UPI000EF7643D|nr:MULTISPECIES: gamma-glutamylcyclotransferase family protein [Halostella]NHN46760.1 gamma-glutamylcyclotransferase [Halostella sp. JP-L12]
MDVFVYGTLTDETRASDLLDDYEFRGPARVEGFERVDGEYPTLAPAPEGSLDGRILRTDDVDALDAYEGVDRGLYVRVSLPGPDGEPVATYVGDPERLGVGAAVEWLGSGPFAERVRRYVRATDAVVLRRE